MIQKIRLFLAFEAFTYIFAVLVHAGVILRGYGHTAARNAEAIIAIVLLGGLLLSGVRPDRIRAIGLTAQGFALLLTLVGIFTIIIGIGPRTVPDIAYHTVIVIVLIWGLIVTKQSRHDERVGQ